MRKSGGGSLAAPFKGFTLAEVLVTLGIIGVVSAMTVPTLMQNHQRKAYVTQLHKVYNIVQQASVQYLTDRNAVNLREAGLNSEDAAANLIKQYFKIVQDCGTDQTPCFAATADYKKISGVTITKWYSKRHFVLADGTAIGTYYVGGQGSGGSDEGGVVTPSGSGTYADPWNVAAAKENQGTDYKFVKGFIVGNIPGGDLEDAQFKL